MATRNITILLVEDDEEALRFEWEEQDLTEFSSIALHVRLDTGKLVTIPAVIIDPGPSPYGITDFEFPAGVLPGGIHKAEVVTIDTLGRRDTLPDDEPIALYVRERV